MIVEDYTIDDLDPTGEIRAVFAQESREQLSSMEDGLLRMEQGDGDSDTLNAIFRAAHTLKGSSGVVELHHIEAFTHILENLLDRVRKEEIALSSEIISALLKGCDHIAALLDRVDQGHLDTDPDLQQAGEIMADLLRSFTREQPPVQIAQTVHVVDTVETTLHRDEESETTTSDCWHISIRFGRDVLRQGMEPLAFLRYLLNLGEIVHLTTLCDAMPPADDMDPEACYLGFEITLRSHVTKEQIENVFAFCRDDCDLTILPPNSRVADFINLIEHLPEETMRLGEILVKTGALTQEELDRGLHNQEIHDPAMPAPSLGEIFVDQKVVQPEIVAAAAAKQKQISDKKTAEAKLIRIQADKLDQLIDLVGELVIAGASVNLLAQKSKGGALSEATSVLSRLVENIRDSALQLRMVQIGETFNRFNRVVRDVSKELGKEIDLVISGAETELDKTVIERIGDPLMHLVRNAMDHGIEPLAVRTAAGKPAKGHITLNAYHDSGSIVIEVIDDGGGLNKDRIEAKALERGLIQPGQALTEQEIVNLVFEAGFSTADKVSNLSGRGVGMDVVKRNIQALRGTIDIQTTPGIGSRFIIRLPLTLAIIDGFLTSVGAFTYVIPLHSVVECLAFDGEATCGHMLNLRGEVLPFIRLREFFEVNAPPPPRENVVVISAGTHKAGIVVDQLLGEFQTVIKPMSSLFKHLRGIGGSTILGSGDVALILDVQALIELVTHSENQTFQQGETLCSRT